MPHSSRPASDLPDWLILVLGAMALALAMGIGRFAFTPLMPLKLRDGTLTAAQGAEWAMLNYVGYLLGALTAARFSAQPLRGLQLALYGVAATTLAVAWVGQGLPVWSGALLRTVAGVFSAWALVCTSSWCLGEMARRHLSHRGAWIYVGVGKGIALAGVVAWLGGHQRAQALWLEFGVVTLLGALLLHFLARPSPPGTSTTAAPATPSQTTPPGTLGLIVCYGIFGFGYIMPATFLPTLARQQISDPMVFGLTWPLFGAAAAISVAVAALWMSGWSRHRLWAVAQAIMAIGTLMPLLHPALWSLALSAVLVGGTFLLTNMGGLQLARAYAPDNPTPLLARMTVAFAAGQILGPLLVRAIGEQRWLGWDALAWGHASATVLLLLTAAWLWQASRQPGAA
ncbi:YbfB/YjiJ family MFS transporter [Brachymonas chironomi]|uniref:YbfB/YjiJ family MFS transporter n=1 Tax=Brachymonas chironomi TaxID=491919 RepID=UPI00036B6FCC|nr:YbfB/YjiJ family MFS transporter [Brachymonas chironomi]